MPHGICGDNELFWQHLRSLDACIIGQENHIHGTDPQDRRQFLHHPNPLRPQREFGQSETDDKTNLKPRGSWTELWRSFRENCLARNWQVLGWYCCRIWLASARSKSSPKVERTLPGNHTKRPTSTESYLQDRGDEIPSSVGLRLRNRSHIGTLPPSNALLLLKSTERPECGYCHGPKAE